jgi:S1-C subfamily serine protease
MGSKSLIVVLIMTSLLCTVVVQGFILSNSNVHAGLALPNVPYIMIPERQQQIPTTSQDHSLQHTLPINQPPTKTIDTSIKNIALPNTGSTQTPNLTALFKQVENSVVQITARTPNPNLQIIINGNPLEGQSTRLGSGFVYDKQGHVVTNNHVIDGAKTADLTFVDGNTYTAKVIGSDPSGDLAVLQITDNFSAEKVVPLPIANSSSLQVGQQVIALGNPFGLSDTMTTGIISQIGRLLPNPDTGFSIPNGIQTDAPINPGNSGGPLLNTEGQVVGLNTAISSSTGEFSGIGFAIPSNAITKEVPRLIQTGTYSHPWLGIAGGAITPDISQGAGLPRNYKGVAIGSVQTDSPAQKAGLQGMSQDQSSSTQHVGDIIIRADGHPLRSIDDLINYIDTQKSVGDNVMLALNRHGQIMNINVVLGTRPASLGNATEQQSILP